MVKCSSKVWICCRYGVQEGTIVKVSCLSDNAASAGAAEIAAEDAAEDDIAMQGAEGAVETPGGFEAEVSHLPDLHMALRKHEQHRPHSCSSCCFQDCNASSVISSACKASQACCDTGHGMQASEPAAAPDVKEEPNLNQQDAEGSLGVKREAEIFEDAQAVAKRIKTEPA